MFTRLRSHLTPPTVLAALALVFALTGGAFAAGRYLITSKSQISPKVLAQLQSRSGARGPAGPAGAAGARGEHGSPGQAGPAGPVGPAGPAGPVGPAGVKGEGPTGAQSVTASEFVGEAGACPAGEPKGPGDVCCTEGGVELKAGTTAPVFVCNGEAGTDGRNGTNGATGPQGATGPEGNIKTTLTSGVSETGVWAAATAKPPVILSGVKGTLASISFTIPLAEELLVADHQVHVIAEGQNGQGEGTGCPATSEAAKPEAEPGNLCLFISSAEGLSGITPKSLESTTGAEGAGRTGSVLYLVTTAKELHADGTWAVTAK